MPTYHLKGRIRITATYYVDEPFDGGDEEDAIETLVSQLDISEANDVDTDTYDLNVTLIQDADSEAEEEPTDQMLRRIGAPMLSL